jgi:hypothetical protein
MALMEQKILVPARPDCEYGPLFKNEHLQTKNRYRIIYTFRYKLHFVEMSNVSVV